MPAPGAQHAASIANPFEEPQQRVSSFTAQEIATLQSRLEKQLGPEYISSRAGPSGQKVHYISAEKCIALANEVFGFNGWSSGIQNIQVDFVDENPQTLKISLGLSVIVRVTLRDGTYHEDIGYGHIENCKGKAAAFEKAKKEGTTDGLKRALRNFGNVLGNCIYDKAYLAKVTKLKVEPTRFDELTLHRHADFSIKTEPVESTKTVHAAPAQPQEYKPTTAAPPPGPAKESNELSLLSSDSFEEFMSELDEADFNVVEEGHPDEVVLSNEARERASNAAKQQNKPVAMQPPSLPIAKSGSNGGGMVRQPQTPNQASRMGPSHGPQNGNQQSNGAGRPQVTGMSGQNNARHSTPQPPVNTATNGQQTNAPTGAPPGADAPGFFSARAVSSIPEESLINQQIAPKGNLAFNPHAESPSIRKTPGIDHTKSKPLSRTGQHVAPSQSADSANLRPLGPAAAAGQGPAAHPQIDHGRRIGAPMGSASPLANRGQYRPPTMKRPAGQDSGPGQNQNQAQGQGPGRTALTELSSNNPPTGVASGPDSKRQRVA